MKALALRTLAVAGALASFHAAAATCPGAPPFTDVSAASAFCTNIEWLKNRQISLGCGGTAYCPLDFVTREQMAAFMNRLGTALTPVVQYTDDSFAALGEFACQTPDFVVADFPRQAQAFASLSAQFDAAGQWVGRIHVSTDGGVNWTNLNGAVVHRASSSGAALWSHLTQQATRVLNVGSTYRFAVTATLLSGSVNLTDGRCTLTVRIENRNGTSSPLDQPVSVGHADGD